MNIDLKGLQDFRDVEIATCVSTWRGHCYVFNWYRLLPGEMDKQPLGTWNDGSYDALDASKERKTAWPEATDVTPYALENELARRQGKAYTACTHEQCSKLAYEVCNTCGKAICFEHYREADFENWCVGCWYTHMDMLHLDGNIDPSLYKEIRRERHSSIASK